MNKIISSLCIAASACALSSCVSEIDDIFDKSAIERLEQTKVDYAKRLSDNGGCWIMEYYPSYGTEAILNNGVLFTVEMNADYRCRFGQLVNRFDGKNTKQEYVDNVSTWEIITDNGPVLSFNTYNELLHNYSKPNDVPGTRDDETGTGYGGDYEFVVTSLPESADVAMLKGKKTGVYTRLSRIPANTDFEEYLTDVNTFKKQIFPVNGNELDITINDHKYYIKQMDSSMPAYWPADGDSVINKKIVPFLMSKLDGKYHLRFRDAIGEDDNVEQEFVYNADKDYFEGVTNNTNLLEGPDPTVYFVRSIQNFTNEKKNRYNWQFVRTNNMGNDFSGLFGRLNDGITALGSNAKFVDIQLYGVYDTQDLILRIAYSYKSGKNTLNGYAFLRFTYEDTGNHMKLTYQGPSDDTSAKFLERVPAAKEFADFLNGDYHMEADPSRFDLSSVRIMSSAKPEFWFAVKRTNANDDK